MAWIKPTCDINGPSSGCSQPCLAPDVPLPLANQSEERKLAYAIEMHLAVELTAAISDVLAQGGAREHPCLTSSVTPLHQHRDLTHSDLSPVLCPFDFRSLVCDGKRGLLTRLLQVMKKEPAESSFR